MQVKKHNNTDIAEYIPEGMQKSHQRANYSKECYINKLKNSNGIEQENISRQNFETSQRLQEEIILYKEYLIGYNEEEQKEILEELDRTAELLVNEYLKVQADYYCPISEANYLEVLLHGKTDKLPPQKKEKQ